MSFTGDDVRAVWTLYYERALGVKRGGNSFKKHQQLFDEFAATFVGNRDQLEHFVRAQIQHAISHGRSAYPNYLKAHNAYEIAKNAPTNEQTIKSLRKSFKSQYTAFKRVVETCGVKVAFANHLADYDPLFLVFVSMKWNQPISKETALRTLNQLGSGLPYEQAFTPQAIEEARGYANIFSGI